VSFGTDLLSHAIELVGSDSLETEPNEINSRRAVSASYYGLFHQINGDAVDLIAPNVPTITNHRIQRWFDHAEMKRVCSRFLPAQLDRPLLDLIGSSSTPDLQTVARSFIQLQDARHRADYDLSYKLDLQQARQHVELAVTALKSWKQIKGTPEANIFILSLLMWKNWERER
jgi:hypothetical protein